MNRRLFRSPDDRVLAGVAGGMAETYDFDPALVRVMWALLILVSGGLFLILYIIMALVVPLRPAGMSPWGPNPAEANTPGGAPSDATPPVPPTMPGATPPPTGYYRHYRRHDGSGTLIIGLLLVLAGAYFLAREYIPALSAALVGPVLVIGVGLLLVVFAFGRGRPAQ